MRVKLLLSGFVLSLAALVGGAATAHAVTPTTCVSGPVWWPTSGRVVSSAGAQRSITLNFKMTQTQLNALACLGGYAKADFVAQNAGVSGTQYSLSTNVPGVREVPLVSSSFTPGVTAIALGGLQANYSYYVTATWTDGAANPTFTSDFVAAHWASSLFEKNICQNGQSKGGQAWCVFQTLSERHSLTGGNVALGGTYSLQ